MKKMNWDIYKLEGRELSYKHTTFKIHKKDAIALCDEKGWYFTISNSDLP